MLFSGFALAAFVEGMQGRASCGCFGPLAVRPWYTLALDLMAVASLVICGPVLGGFRGKRFAVRGMIAGLMLMLALGSVAHGVASSAPGAGVVVLEPETWVGKRLPILDAIDIGDQLARGEWLVVFYRDDCPRCQEELPKYARLAARWRAAGSKRRVAAIEVPSGTTKSNLSVARWHRIVLGKLDERHAWFAKLPLVVVLENGNTLLAGETARSRVKSVAYGAR